MKTECKQTEFVSLHSLIHAWQAQTHNINIPPVSMALPTVISNSYKIFHGCHRPTATLVPVRSILNRDILTTSFNMGIKPAKKKEPAPAHKTPKWPAKKPVPKETKPLQVQKSKPAHEDEGRTST